MLFISCWGMSVEFWSVLVPNYGDHCLCRKCWNSAFLEIWVTVELCMKYIGCYYLQLTWGCLVFFSYCRAENAARRLSGEEPLPEEDPNNPIFKPLLEPSRLDSYLITNQIANYCGQVNGYAGPLPWSYGYFFIVCTGYWKKEISIIVFRGRVSICSLESTCVFHSCPL